VNRRASLAFYWVFRGLIVLFCRAFWRVTVEGKEHLPKSGAFIVSPIHRSNIDFAVVAAITSRRMRYMGKDTLWKVKPAGWFFTAMGGFPVRRGTADREALRRCADVIEGGEPLVLFPEGTRQTGPLVGEVFDGAAFLAARTGVPVIPIGVGGSEPAMPKGAKYLKPVKVHVVIGAPLHPERSDTGKASRRAVRELSERLRDELQRLFDEAQRKAGA